MSKMASVTILGGGLAGLSAGVELSANGIDVEVLEKQSDVGGLAKGFDHGDFIFDYGPHRFHTQKEWILERIKNIVGDDFLLRNRKSEILLQGKFYDYPVNAKNAVFSMGALKIMQIGIDYITTVLKNKISSKPDDSFESWVTNRYGKIMYSIFFGPYTEKVWGVHPSQLSPDWASQRITLLNLFDVVKKAIIKPKNEPRTIVSTFYFPKKGIGEISEKMVEVLNKNNDTVLLDVGIKEVKREGDKISAITYECNGKIIEKKYDYVISTIPITDFIKLLNPEPPGQILDATNALNFRAIVFVFLKLNREHVTNNNWTYFPDKDIIFARISEPKNFSPKMSPKDKTSLCVEVMCNEGDAVWMQDDNAIIKKVISDLVKTSFIEQKNVDDAFVRRVTHAYPTYLKGYETHLNMLMGYLRQIKNLELAGRNSIFRYNNMDHSIEMGIKAARNILGEEHEIEEVASEKEYFG